MADAEQLLRTNVKALMEDRNWNRADLAERMRRTRTWASDFLNGKASVPVSALSELAEVFAVPIDELFKPVLSGTELHAHKKTTRDLLGQTLGIHSASQALPKETHGSPSPTALHEDPDVLRDYTRRVRITLRAVSTQLRALADEPSPEVSGANTARPQPRAMGGSSRGRHARGGGR